jgi:hypothetical protein
MSTECKRLGELWRAVFGEPPPLAADPATLTQVLVRYLPPAPPYEPAAPAPRLKPPP